MSSDQKPNLNINDDSACGNTEKWKTKMDILSDLNLSEIINHYKLTPGNTVGNKTINGIKEPALHHAKSAISKEVKDIEDTISKEIEDSKISVIKRLNETVHLNTFHNTVFGKNYDTVKVNGFKSINARDIDEYAESASSNVRFHSLQHNNAAIHFQNQVINEDVNRRISFMNTQLAHSKYMIDNRICCCKQNSLYGNNSQSVEEFDMKNQADIARYMNRPAELCKTFGTLNIGKDNLYHSFKSTSEEKSAEKNTLNKDVIEQFNDFFDKYENCNTQRDLKADSLNNDLMTEYCDSKSPTSLLENVFVDNDLAVKYDDDVFDVIEKSNVSDLYSSHNTSHKYQEVNKIESNIKQEDHFVNILHENIVNGDTITDVFDDLKHNNEQKSDTTEDKTLEETINKFTDGHNIRKLTAPKLNRTKYDYRAKSTEYHTNTNFEANTSNRSLEVSSIDPVLNDQTLNIYTHCNNDDEIEKTVNAESYDMNVEEPHENLDDLIDEILTEKRLSTQYSFAYTLTNNCRNESIRHDSISVESSIVNQPDGKPAVTQSINGQTASSCAAKDEVNEVIFKEHNTNNFKLNAIDTNPMKSLKKLKEFNHYRVMTSHEERDKKIPLPNISKINDKVKSFEESTLVEQVLKCKTAMSELSKTKNLLLNSKTMGSREIYTRITDFSTSNPRHFTIPTVQKDKKLYSKRRLIKSDTEKRNFTKGPTLYEKSVVLPQILERLSARKEKLDLSKNFRRRLVLDRGTVGVDGEKLTDSVCRNISDDAKKV